MDWKKTTGLCLVSAALGGYAVRALVPMVVTKTEIQTKDVVHNQIVTVTKVVERPDGTKETVTRTKDNSTSESDKSIKNVVTQSMQPQWHLGISYSTAGVYTGTVERRVLGPIYVGVRGQSDGTVAGVVGLEF